MIQLVDAHLIVFCDSETNALIGAEIWSEEPWMQSQGLAVPAYIAMQAKGNDFWDANTVILYNLTDPMWISRHPIYPKIVGLLKEGGRGQAYRTFYKSDEYLTNHARVRINHIK